jgi:hypothetical protein
LPVVPIGRRFSHALDLPGSGEWPFCAAWRSPSSGACTGRFQARKTCDFRPYVSRPISTRAVPSALCYQDRAHRHPPGSHSASRARRHCQLTSTYEAQFGDQRRLLQIPLRKSPRRTGRRRESSVKALDAETLGYDSLPIGRVPSGAPIRNALSTTFRAVGSVLDGSLRLQFFASIARLPTNRPLINH